MYLNSFFLLNVVWGPPASKAGRHSKQYIWEERGRRWLTNRSKMYPWKLSIRSHSKHPQGMYSMQYRAPDSWYFRTYRMWLGKGDEKFREWARLWLSGCFSNLASAKAQIKFFIFKRQARRKLNEKIILHPFWGNLGPFWKTFASRVGSKIDSDHWWR